MSVTLTRKFWDGTQYTNVSKIVFTSTNIDSPAVAGTRSHVLPGSPYIGTWYEAVDMQYKQKSNQDAPDKQECLFSQLFLYQNSFDMSNDSSATMLSRYPVLSSGIQDRVIFNDRNNHYLSDSFTADGMVTHSGIEYYKYNTSVVETTGTTISGAYQFFLEDAPTISGAQGIPGSFYVWQNTTTSSGVWADPKNSIIFEVEQGEIYNCRLTAWDDVTHSSTNNRILREGKYKVTCCAYKYGSGSKSRPFSDDSVDIMVHPPGIDISLCGNDSYYGDFDLVHISDGGSSGFQGGEFLYFAPRLDDIDDSYVSGNYDFVTTLHYQYT
jgi:hypothetical protein